MQGKITKQISNQYTVSVDEENYVCSARGKFRNIGISPTVGDNVEFDEKAKIIEDILPRNNYLHRPTVANIDIALVITSIKKPDLSLSLLDKQICVIKDNNITPVIVLTKLDLLNKNEKKELKHTMKYYKNLGISVLTNKDLGKLKRLLKNKVVVLTGQTGAGKSSLLNKLDKSLNIKTSEISDALNRGVHTTRHTEIYKIGKIYFVDTPGFSSLDLKGIKEDRLKSYFDEFSKYDCDFSDCMHVGEENCGVKKALGKGLILPSRYINYTRFLKECHENSSKLFK